ncbi:MAG: hypothetical protein L6R39_003269, partial [Caloplaca ligustica]
MAGEIAEASDSKGQVKKLAHDLRQSDLPRAAIHRSQVPTLSPRRTPDGTPPAPSAFASPIPKFPDPETVCTPFSYEIPWTCSNLARPAFILYRQHYQAHVVAENPGLANPEISKVIGDYWRQSPPEVKAHWKNLAE